MQINIRAMNMELTPAIQQYIEEKISSLEKYLHNIQMVDVDAGKLSNHHQKGDVFTCSLVITLPGDLIKIEKQAEDLYKAIDAVKDHCRDLLVQRKEKGVDEKRRAAVEE